MPINIDRGPGKALIEHMMVDAVTVTRPARGPGAKVLNEGTGRMEIVEQPASIFVGFALLATIRNKDKETTIGETPTDLNGYSMLVPLSATSSKVATGDPNDIKAGDLVTVTAGQENPAMAGNVLKVVQAENTTHSVYRRLIVRQETDSPDNPEF